MFYCDPHARPQRLGQASGVQRSKPLKVMSFIVVRIITTNILQLLVINIRNADAVLRPDAGKHSSFKVSSAASLLKQTYMYHSENCDHSVSSYYEICNQQRQDNSCVETVLELYAFIVLYLIMYIVQVIKFVEDIRITCSTLRYTTSTRLSESTQVHIIYL